MLGKFRKQGSNWSLELGVAVGRKERNKVSGGLWPVGQNEDHGVPLRNLDFMRQYVGH